MRKKLLPVMVGSLLLVGGMSIGAFASSQLEEIKAYLNKDLKVRVHGKVAQLNDEQGNAVLPITYEGNTYLPVRGIASLLDVAVHFDPDAYEVILGERLEGIAINQEQFDDTLYSKDPSQTTFGGKDYGEVLFSPAGKNIQYAALTPDGKYQKLYLQFAAIGKDIESIEIKDDEKNALLKKVGAITTADGMQTIEVDIAGVQTLSINVSKKHDGAFVIPLTTSYYK
jgi:hypothetical protein